VKITNTKGIGVDTLKILILGESGAGKTSLAKTIDEPTIIISAEAGLLCLRSSSIDVIDITVDNDGRIIPKEKRIDRLAEAYSYLNTDDAKKKYKWIFIDSLSEISQNMIERLQQEFPDRKDSLVLYGENAKRMRSLVKSFRDLPGYNVVFTALSVVDKDENNQRFIGPSVVGSFADKLPAFFDEVFYLYVEKNNETGEASRKLITEKTDKLMVKDRSGSLAAVEPADLSVIAKKIKSTITKEKQK